LEIDKLEVDVERCDVECECDYYECGYMIWLIMSL